MNKEPIYNIMYPCCEKCEIYLDYKDSYQCSDGDCPCHTPQVKEEELIQTTPFSIHSEKDVNKPNTPEPKSSWEEEFREYFDKVGLKPKKPTIGNLDREVIISFISKVIQQAREEEREKTMERLKKLYTILAKYSIDRPIPPSIIRQWQEDFINSIEE